MSTYVFDVGETLVDETRHWQRIADRIGVPRFTLFGVLGGVIEQDRDHRDVFKYFGVDLDALSREIDAENNPDDDMRTEDFYPDAIPTLKALVAAGHRIALAANQPARAQLALEGLGLPVDFVATSSKWGVAKPSPEFFARVIAEAGVAARDIIYVGDRLDFDVRPAKAAGMQAVLIRRGPWGHLHAERPGSAAADRIIDSLAELRDPLVE
jgi:HAD superfamily hydrolase (TIGR01662 family)